MRAAILTLATLALVYRAWSRKSLTPLGIFAAAITAIIHAIHPWNVCFALLASFFLSGTFVTKVKHAQKSTLTTSSSGGVTSTSAAPPPRTATQVLCNSLPATILIALHVLYLRQTPAPSHDASCLLPLYPTTSATPVDNTLTAITAALPYGIIATYAAAAADTFSSELGILSRSSPFLITDILALRTPRAVPPGTNGGVTPAGLVAGLAGGALMGLVAAATTPLCADRGAGMIDAATARAVLVAAAAAWGFAGSVLDSVLGAVVQASIVDVRSGKIVESDGGAKVLYRAAGVAAAVASGGGGRSGADGGGKGKGAAGRELVTGRDIMDNNGVNLAMLSIMAVGAVGCVAGLTVVL